MDSFLSSVSYIYITPLVPDIDSDMARHPG